jgi:hypothetical protein
MKPGHNACGIEPTSFQSRLAVIIIAARIVTRVQTSVKVFPTPPLRHLIDDVRQLDAKALRVESRIHASFPYNISPLKEAVVAVLPLEQVFHMASIFPAAREKRGRALTNIRVDASCTFGIMATRAMDAVEFDAHVESGVVTVVVCCEVDGSRIEVVV